jgi:hypothetical protein
MSFSIYTSIQHMQKNLWIYFVPFHSFDVQIILVTQPHTAITDNYCIVVCGKIRTHVSNRQDIFILKTLW